ncbi:hypothetical protein MSPP1_002328 [Malassezia sp. CBS 17886]|nr:hypothetical protein MSPP1_002328 [Malassezia sp. CBS 17886]
MSYGKSDGKRESLVSFTNEYDARVGGEDWNVLDEEKWSSYKRLETFRRLVAWSRGEGWRGYDHYIGSPILQPDGTQNQIKAVLQSEAVQRAIALIAQRRAQGMLACVHDGKIAPDVVRAFLHAPAQIEGPDVDQMKRVKPKPILSFVEESMDADRNVPAAVQFYSAMRSRLEAELQKQARKIVEKSAARMGSFSFLRVFGAAVNEMLASMYNWGTHVKMEQVLELRRIAREAQAKKQSIVFLPCHKSHIDYLVFSWIMYRIGMAIPYIIAGQNLDMPVVGSILRGGGAFFIRRTFQGDALYPTVIKEYIMMLLERGHNIEMFVEGTRSRTGKLLPPKYGILKYMMTALREQRTSDILICPVSLQYDSVIEAESYVNELLGMPKESESLYGLVSGGSALLQLKMGRIDVRFKEPWSMLQFLEQQKWRRLGSSEGVDMQLLKALGYKVLADINSVSVIMPAALVGAVILTQRGRGFGRSSLISGVTRLRQRILDKGYEVANFGLTNIGDIVDRALSLMKGLIVEHRNLLEPTFEPVKMFELSFYRNQIIHIFVHEALVSAALYTKVKQGGEASAQVMSYKEMYEKCAFISQVLRDEFVFQLTPLEYNIVRTVEELLDHDVFTLTYDDGSAGPASINDWRDGTASVGLSAAERSSGRDNFDTYLFLIWPFIECYWLASLTLLSLSPDIASTREVGTPPPQACENHIAIPWFNRKDFIPCAQKIGNTLYHQGAISYEEAINAATLLNALATMEAMGICMRRMSHEKKPVVQVALHPDWVPHMEPIADNLPAFDKGAIIPAVAPDSALVGRLISFIGQMAHFRREGKSLRIYRSDTNFYNHVYAGGPRVAEWDLVNPQLFTSETRLHL